MVLIDCPDCQKKISHKAERCPHCGYPGPFSKPQGPKLSAKESPDLRLAKFSTFVMISSLFMPYIGNQSGVEIIGMTVELHWPQWNTSPIRPNLMVFDIFMSVVSPIVYLLSAIIGGLTISKGGSPKNIGILHLWFFINMLMFAVVIASQRSSPLGPGGPYSILGYAGIGFWLGGLSGVGFIYQIDDILVPIGRLKRKIKPPF
tara:strand:- start:130 stop:738 length:609 start_codon:yes stop_codon:yes gene_type:complete